MLLVVGLFAYGISLVLFIVSMRHLGTARAGAYFSIAPFFGAILAVALGDQLTWPLGVAAVLMALGVWLHLTERHQHEHTHRSVTHEHAHVHDEHHRHNHEQQVPPGVRHSHLHTHEELTHTHRHYPDTEHRHEH
jgi:hypothetical protein